MVALSLRTVCLASSRTLVPYDRTVQVPIVLYYSRRARKAGMEILSMIKIMMYVFSGWLSLVLVSSLLV
jgi:hypothetical protein